MKKKKGFTLVELLAVIVILAIIMIIAIPAVLNTMQTARKKSFMEYVQKVYNTVQSKWLERSMMGESIDEGIYVYNIKTDLDLPTTGSYGGYVLVNTHYDDNGINEDYYLYIWDDEYFIGFMPKNEPAFDQDKVVMTSTNKYHPWNIKDKSYILNRKEMEKDYFRGINFDDFNDKYVGCFIQFYWIPWGAEDEGIYPIYYIDGSPSSVREGISNGRSKEEREQSLVTCLKS